MPNQRFKKKLHEVMLSYPKGKIINISALASTVGCSPSYMSFSIRMANQAGFISLNPNGQWVCKQIPKSLEEFSEALKEQTSIYRQGLPSSTSKTPRKIRTIAKAVSEKHPSLSEENIISVISAIMARKRELEKENKDLKEKLISISKKVRKILEKRQY